MISHINLLDSGVFPIMEILLRCTLSPITNLLFKKKKAIHILTGKNKNSKASTLCGCKLICYALLVQKVQFYAKRQYTFVEKTTKLLSKYVEISTFYSTGIQD